MHCIVFDLDRTLIYSTPTRDRRFMSFPVLRATMWAHLRPQVVPLLRSLSARADVTLCVWTAGVHDYAHDVVDALCDACSISRGSITVLCRDDATPLSLKDTTVYVKDLRVVQERFGPRASHVVLVDDDPIHQLLPSNRGRIVQVPPFLCDPTDNVLTYLLLQLEILSRANTVVKRPTPVRPRLFLPPI